MMKSRGAILIISLLVILILLSSGAAVLKMIGSGVKIAGMEYERKVSFYLAESGLEKAKVILSANMNWFTDIKHDRSDDVAWLVNGAEGHEENLGQGLFKIVKESGSNIIYSIGYFNGSSRKPAVTILKLEYEIDPFKKLKWDIL
jgi:Tfp pilus assembly protein PilX